MLNSKTSLLGEYFGFFAAATIFSLATWFVSRKLGHAISYAYFIAGIFLLCIIALYMENRKNELSKTFFDRF